MEPIVNPEIKIDKRTKEYKESLEQPSPSEDVESTTTNGTVGCGVTVPPERLAVPIDYSKKENNPGFKLCMHCGGDLPPNDDGSAKRRVQPELCHACVWRNNK